MYQHIVFWLLTLVLAILGGFPLKAVVPDTGKKADPRKAKVAEWVLKSRSLVESNPDSALYLLDLAEQWSQENSYARGVALARLDRAIYWYGDDRARDAYLEADTAMHLFLGARDTIAAAHAANIKGISLERLGRHPASLEALQLSLDWGRGLRDSTVIGNALNNIAKSYITVNDLENARHYLLKALKIARDISNKQLTSNALLNLGVVYGKREILDSALYYYAETRNIAESIGHQEMIGKSYINLGSVYQRKGEYQRALQFGKMAREVTRKYTYASDQVYALSVMGEAYTALGRSRLALQCLNQASHLADSIQFWDGIVEIQENYASYYEATGDYQRALFHMRRATEIEDSIIGKEMRMRILRHEANTRIERKDEQIASLAEREARQKRKYRQTISVMILAFLLLILMAAGAWQLLRFRTRTKIAEIERKIAESKLEALRSQMNPHFIFNSFNAIQNFVLKAEKIEAYNYLNRFATLLRSIVGNSSKLDISLEDEIKLLQNYLELEALRFQSKFSFEVIVEPQLRSANPCIPSMMIQPHLENAILHGLSNLEGSGQLTLRMYSRNAGLIVEIEDNGIGRRAALEIKRKTDGQHLSVASMNGHARLKFLRQTGYSDAHIEIEDREEQSVHTGTLVRIYLPFVKKRKSYD